MFAKGEPRPPNAGRRRGTPNKVAASIKELCQKAGPELVAELLRLAKHGKQEMTRVAAARELLDRAYGKPKQTVDGEVFVGVSLQLKQLLEAHDGQSRSIPTRTNELLTATVVDAEPNGSDKLN